MATKYVKIIATGPSVKVSDGKVTAVISQPAVVARNTAPVVNTVPDPVPSVNVAITGLPGDGRKVNEPLFKYVGDNYTLITNFSMSLSKALFDAIAQTDKITLLDGKLVLEAVDPTDDFDGLATAEDDQYATFSKVTMETVSDTEAISLDFSTGVSEFLSDTELYTFGIGKNIADVMGNKVERMIFDLSTVLTDTPVSNEAVSMGPSIALGDVGNRVDILWFGIGPGVADPSVTVDAGPVFEIAPTFSEAPADTEEFAVSFSRGLIAELPTETEELSLGFDKGTVAETVTKGDSGLLLMQGYFSEDYWFDDYNGVSLTF
jgi:hypothetical protein